MLDLTHDNHPELATCSITELGFVRVISQVAIYDVSFDQAQRLLQSLRKAKTYRFEFIVDNNDVSKLPAWVSTAKQSTDGHLAQLAISNGAILATLDKNIPGSFVIPANQ